jgi:hypothetical protein
MLTLNFYMDDSGTRKPDRAPMVFDPRRPNHFALGGIIVVEDEEDQVRAEHAALCASKAYRSILLLRSNMGL